MPDGKEEERKMQCVIFQMDRSLHIGDKTFKETVISDDDINKVCDALKEEGHKVVDITPIVKIEGMYATTEVSYLIKYLENEIQT